MALSRYGEWQLYIILPVLDARIPPGLRMQMEGNPFSVLRRMAYQTIQGLSFLHKNHLCHGG